MSTLPPAIGFVRRPIRTVTRSARLELRESFGDLSSSYWAAVDELQRGQLQNAWVGFQLVLNTWMRQHFLDLTGRLHSPIHDSQLLLTKLRSGSVVDRWTFDVLRTILSAPKPVTWLSVEVLAGIVEIVCLDDVPKTDFPALAARSELDRTTVHAGPSELTSLI